MTETGSHVDGFTFPTQRTCPFSPPQEYTRMRGEGPPAVLAPGPGVTDAAREAASVFR